MRRYLFGKTILDIPDNHKIRDIHKQDALYDRAFGFILDAITAWSPEGVIFDVGANIGDTASMIAAHVSNPIVSVEGGEEFLPYLRANAALIGSQVTVVERFLRPKAFGDISLRYDSGGGTGAFVATNAGNDRKVDTDRFISVQELLQFGARRAPQVSLIKSDTDGVDGFLLLDYLDQADCPLFFECDTVHTLGSLASPWPAVFETLTARNYRLVIYDNFGLPLAVADHNPCALLRDLAGYIHMQHCTQPVRLHYLDVWAFPPSAGQVFDRVAREVRSRFLRPFGF